MVVRTIKRTISSFLGIDDEKVKEMKGKAGVIIYTTDQNFRSIAEGRLEEPNFQVFSCGRCNSLNTDMNNYACKFLIDVSCKNGRDYLHKIMNFKFSIEEEIKQIHSEQVMIKSEVRRQKGRIIAKEGRLRSAMSRVYLLCSKESFSNIKKIAGDMGITNVYTRCGIDEEERDKIFLRILGK